MITSKKRLYLVALLLALSPLFFLGLMREAHGLPNKTGNTGSIGGPVHDLHEMLQNEMLQNEPLENEPLQNKGQQVENRGELQMPHKQLRQDLIQQDLPQQDLSKQDLLQQAITMLNERDKQIKQLLGDDGKAIPDSTREELKKMINEVIDYNYMAKEALQETYSDITPEQRDEFVTLFSSMIRDNSLANPDIYRAAITYDDARQTNGTIFVDTTAELDDVRTTVGYLLEYRANEWHILDMSVDGVSTVESYRRQFQSIIRKRGFEPLLNSLRKRAERNQP